jgi:protein involved in sex pheromone biosynthesis
MKRTLILILSAIILLSACGTNDNDKKESSNNKQSTKNDSGSVKKIATDKNVQGSNYRTILPFKESQSRGLLQDNMANSYNGEDFEDGLLDLSKQVFPTKDYLYQDGQYLDKDTTNAYLKPKYTKAEIDKMSSSERKDKKANENLGLNPSHNGETDPEKIAKNSPAYLSNILEQDFYDNGDTKGKKIKGMTIGLAMNGTYYYQKEKDGDTFSKKLDDKEIKKQGKQMATDKYFSDIDEYEIHIKDGNNPKALISKSKDEDKPKVHIYTNSN